MKVVLDTNVLVSGIFFGKGPGRILELWFEKKFLAYATPLILEEYLRVTREFSQKNEELSRLWSTSLLSLCHILADPDKESYAVLSRDPKDDKFLLCALQAKADYLITGDEDLKILPDIFPFKVITPRQFLQLF